MEMAHALHTARERASLRLEARLGVRTIKSLAQSFRVVIAGAAYLTARHKDPGTRRWRWLPRFHWIGAWPASMSRASNEIAPVLERLARTPCPMASFASSGIKFLSSALARS